MQRQRGHELGGDSAREHAEVGRRRLQLDRPGLEARQVEQAGRELAQASHLLAQLPYELAPGVLVEVLVLDQLEEAAERDECDDTEKDQSGALPRELRG